MNTCTFDIFIGTRYFFDFVCVIVSTTMKLQVNIKKEINNKNFYMPNMREDLNYTLPSARM